MASGISAIGGRNRQIVIIIDVAERAGHIGVSSGEQEPGRAVVEYGRRPTDCVVACRALGGRKSCPSRRVHGIVGLLPG